MLGLPTLKKKTDEEIKKDLERKRQKVLDRADILRPFVKKDSSGWREYVGLLQEYIDACKKRKAITALDRLLQGVPWDEQVLHELKLIDHEIFILSWVLQFPFKEIARADEIIKEGNK